MEVGFCKIVSKPSQFTSNRKPWGDKKTSFSHIFYTSKRLTVINVIFSVYEFVWKLNILET